MCTDMGGKYAIQTYLFITQQSPLYNSNSGEDLGMLGAPTSMEVFHAHARLATNQDCELNSVGTDFRHYESDNVIENRVRGLEEIGQKDLVRFSTGQGPSYRIWRGIATTVGPERDPEVSISMRKPALLSLLAVLLRAQSSEIYDPRDFQ